jgi:hypothetical protein
MDKLIQRAVKDMRDHFKRCTPVTAGRGLKETNIAFEVSHVFRKAGYLIYPEYRFRRGSIDAVFIRKDEAIICEWKQLYKNSIHSIKAQTNRMRKFASVINFEKRGFKGEIRKIRFLWVCDTWEDDLHEWWLGHKCKEPSRNPFKGWKRGDKKFESFGDGWNPYYWLWAYSEKE